MTEGIVRGCGKRVQGGVYVVTKLSPFGIPINSFLFDPPWVPIDTEGNVHYPGAVGLHLVENPYKEGVVDLWDWIGEQYYPYFPDFWEEARLYGLSRRISSNTNFEQLSKDSGIIGFHRKGILKGSRKFYEYLLNTFEKNTFMDLCPQNYEHRLDDKENIFCVRYLWQLVDEVEEYENRLHVIPIPRSSNNLQNFYMAAYYPDWIKSKQFKVEWIPAAMFRLPIHRLEIVKDPIGGLHELALEKIEKSVTDIPYQVVTE